MKAKILKCQDCGKKKKDVEKTYCPFDLDIYDKKTPVVLCNDCYILRAREI